MFGKIKDILFGKSYEWKYTSLSQTYDLTKHPDISDDSIIKEFTMKYSYRYCPKYKILQRKNLYIHTHDYIDISISQNINYLEVKDLIDNSNLSYKRDSKLKKLVNKKSRS